ncbi:hypothetical protein VTO73DRAFT_11137 [Trametes versicolor]
MFPMSRRFLPVAVIYALAQRIGAQTTLYIPGLDPQPITADIVGVDTASSPTTWLIGPGVTSDVFPETVSSFLSATLIVGPTGAHLIADDPTAIATLLIDCAVDSGSAVCIAVDSKGGTGGQMTHTVFTDNAASGLASAAQVGTAGVTIMYKTVQAGQTTGTGSTSGSSGSVTATPIETSASSSVSRSGASREVGSGAIPGSTGTATNGVGRVGPLRWGIAAGAVVILSALHL